MATLMQVLALLILGLTDSSAFVPGTVSLEFMLVGSGVYMHVVGISDTFDDKKYAPGDNDDGQGVAGCCSCLKRSSVRTRASKKDNREKTPKQTMGGGGGGCRHGHRQGRGNDDGA